MSEQTKHDDDISFDEILDISEEVACLLIDKKLDFVRANAVLETTKAVMFETNIKRDLKSELYEHEEEG